MSTPNSSVVIFAVNRVRRYFLIYAITYFFYGFSLILLGDSFWSTPSLYVLFQLGPRQAYGAVYCVVAIYTVYALIKDTPKSRDSALIAMTILASFWFAGQVTSALSDYHRLRAGGILLWGSQIALHLNMLSARTGRE